jgi:hypothetical protein
MFADDAKVTNQIFHLYRFSGAYDYIAQTPNNAMQ